MTKKNNKGFSLIEVIIAVAVFAILIVPLTSQLISAVNINKKSTKKQYAIDKAEQIMESFKTADMSSSAISIPDGNSTGSYNFTCTTTTPKTTDNKIAGVKKVNYTEKTYTCNDISIGGNYAKYGCTVTVSDLAQQVAAMGYIWDPATGDAKVDENGDYVKITSSVGTVRTLDNKQAAIIAGATYTGDTGTADGNNLDNQASSYFKDQKTELLKNHTVQYNQMLSSDGDEFWKNDEFSKTTTIKVSKTANNKYRVQCIVEYVDKTTIGVIKSEYENNTNNVYKPASANGEGVVYQNDYDKLPPIYLLYVPATSNGIYVNRDYVNIDTNALDADEKAKIYIFQTVADIDDKYAEIINEALQGGDSSKTLDDLIYVNNQHNVSPSSVKVRVNFADSTGTLKKPADEAKINTLAGKTKVYANFTVDKPNSTVSVMGTKDDTADDVYMYDLTVLMEEKDSNDKTTDKTTISGTRGN
jgi:prepilin-type N-terminal cleavage/methylation domain-containing protein